MSNTPKQKGFLTHLRNPRLSLDILCLQEVSAFHRQEHLTDDQIHYFSQYLFPQRSLSVNKHTAIICLNPKYSLNDVALSMDERILTASVLDQNQQFIVKIACVYAPANPTERPAFISAFLSSPVFSAVDTEPWIIMGDFNMNLTSPDTARISTVTPLFEWLHTHFFNSFPEGRPTFSRPGANGSTVRSTIDFIFSHCSLQTSIRNCQYHPPCQSFSDHTLLSIDLILSQPPIGPGSWRFNPHLLDQDDFCELISVSSSLFFDTYDLCTRADSSHTKFEEDEPDDENEIFQSRNLADTPQGLWDIFKRLLKQTAIKHTVDSKRRRDYTISKLNQERLSLLSSPDNHANRLAEIEFLLDQAIQKETQTHMLRSATRWHDKGERNNKYFYQVIKERQSHQTIQSLKSSSTGLRLSSIQDMMAETKDFYQRLFTPDPIDITDVHHLLDHIPSEACLSTSQADHLIAPVSRIDIYHLLCHAPANKSPGLDGLPFELYRYLWSYSRPFRRLLTKIIRDAFLGLFPLSWTKTRMVLLFKKGDPESLANWRPLSLINSDAKLFTKLLANRFNTVLPTLINPYQTGFMPDRLISDNGWLNQLLMQNARHCSQYTTTVAVLLDQEKAYDRVHPEYLKLVLLKFGFPPSLVSSISSLFFGTLISISINGWLGSPIKQQRGLRQGDPISPLLFNLAFEPLLRSILHEPRLPGISLLTPRLPTRTPVPVLTPYVREGTPFLDKPMFSFSSPPPVVKLLSYADDLEVFLSQPDEWIILIELLQQYGRASNAKVNVHKTVMVSLSGKRHIDWITLATSANLSWHDEQSTGAVRYLGYPLYHTSEQLACFLDNIKLKILRHTQFLKGRHLSVRGTGLIANSLLLSRLWHLLRVINPPGTWLRTIKTIVKDFVVPFHFAPSWNKLCLPRKHGGVGLVHIHDQALDLQLLYIQRLLHKTPSFTDFVTPWITKTVQLYTGHASILPWLMFPAKFSFSFRSLTQFQTLGNLLKRLPPLQPHHEWSGRWYMDLPLKTILQVNPMFPERSPPLNLKLFPMHLLLSSMFTWLPSVNRLQLNTPLQLSRLQSLHVALDPSFFLNDDPPTLLFPPMISTLIWPSNTPSSPVSTESFFSWVPSTNHWRIPCGPNKQVTISDLSLNDLRKYWHPLTTMFSPPRLPPLWSPNYARLRPHFWRFFWKLPMSSKAFTPWWRLLQGSINTRHRLHCLHSTQDLDLHCAHCNTGIEDEFHFLVDCPVKWPFWSLVLEELNLSTRLPTSLHLWTAFVSFTYFDSKTTLDTKLATILGSALAIFWKYHYHCHFQQDAWSTTAALRRLH